MRYSTSVADEKNDIPMVVRRKRMAHSEKSNLSKTVYAKCDKKVFMESGPSESGPSDPSPSDSCPSESGPSDSCPSESCRGPILMNPVDLEDDKLVFKPKWFKFANDAMRIDFEECTTLVTNYVEDDDPLHFNKLKERFNYF